MKGSAVTERRTYPKCRPQALCRVGAFEHYRTVITDYLLEFCDGAEKIG